MSESIIAGAAKPAGALAAGNKKRVGPWTKNAGDERPCSQVGCTKEGHFVPVLTVHGKNDTTQEDVAKRKNGRFYVAILPVLLCVEHAVTDPAQYVPDEMTLKNMRDALGDEPDLSQMTVQFVGNENCNAGYALTKALEQGGLYEPPKAVGATKIG